MRSDNRPTTLDPGCRASARRLRGCLAPPARPCGAVTYRCYPGTKPSRRSSHDL